MGAAASVALCAELVPGVRTAITGRWGGVSQPPHDPLNLGLSIGDDPVAVMRNRELAARACGIDAAQVVWMRQVHGARASYVRPGEPAVEADAIFTDMPGVVLGVLAADCAPVLLVDPGTGIVGAAHSGRCGHGSRRGARARPRDDRRRRAAFADAWPGRPGNMRRLLRGARGPAGPRGRGRATGSVPDPVRCPGHRHQGRNRGTARRAWRPPRSP